MFSLVFLVLILWLYIVYLILFIDLFNKDLLRILCVFLENV